MREGQLTAIPSVRAQNCGLCSCKKKVAVLLAGVFTIDLRSRNVYSVCHGTRPDARECIRLGPRSGNLSFKQDRKAFARAAPNPTGSSARSRPCGRDPLPAPLFPSAADVHPNDL